MLKQWNSRFFYLTISYILLLFLVFPNWIDLSWFVFLFPNIHSFLLVLVSAKSWQKVKNVWNPNGSPIVRTIGCYRPVHFLLIALGASLTNIPIENEFCETVPEVNHPCSAVCPPLYVSISFPFMPYSSSSLPFPSLPFLYVCMYVCPYVCMSSALLHW